MQTDEKCLITANIYIWLKQKNTVAPALISRSDFSCRFLLFII